MLRCAAVLFGLMVCQPLFATDIAKVRAVIQLPSMDITGMFSFSSHQIGYVGETPLLFEQIKEAEAELKQRPDSMELLRKCCSLKTQVRENYTNPKFLLPMLEAEQRNVRANPKEANAHRCLAYVLLRLERFPEAEKAARTALELDPEDIDSHYCLYSVLKNDNPTVAEQHLNQVEKLIPESDLDWRLTVTTIRANAAIQKWRSVQHYSKLQQVGSINLPMDMQQEQSVAQANFTKSMHDVEQVLTFAGRKLKNDAGQCGLNTRDKCLSLLVMRDMYRMAGTEHALNVNGLKEADEKTYSETIKLIRELIPYKSNDPTRLTAALFIETICDPSIQGKSSEFPKRLAARAEPYLKRLGELSQDRDQARAATASYLLAMVHKIKGSPSAISIPKLRECTKQYPEFSDGWLMLLVECIDSKNFELGCKIAEEWHQKIGSEVSLCSKMKMHAEADDWATVQKLTEAGRKQFPNSAWFQLSEVACLLQVQEPKVRNLELEAKLKQISEHPSFNGDINLKKNHLLLSGVKEMLEGNRTKANENFANLHALGMKPDLQRKVCEALLSKD